MNVQYTNDQGEIILTVSSNIPGITFMPAVPATATELTHEEYQDFIETVETQNADYAEPDLRAEIQNLKADVTDLQTNNLASAEPNSK